MFAGFAKSRRSARFRCRYGNADSATEGAVSTVLLLQRRLFYSSDGREPRHVHVERDDNRAKFWLEPIRLQSSIGFRPNKIREIQRVVEQHRDTLVRSWNAYFAKE